MISKHGGHMLRQQFLRQAQCLALSSVDALPKTAVLPRGAIYRSAYSLHKWYFWSNGSETCASQTFLMRASKEGFPCAESRRKRQSNRPPRSIMSSIAALVSSCVTVMCRCCISLFLNGIIPKFCSLAQERIEPFLPARTVLIV